MTSGSARARVLLVSPVGERGGAEQVLLALTDHLPALGFDPVLALLRPGPMADLAADRGLRAHVFREHRYREVHQVVHGVRWLQSLISREGAALVHSNHAAHLYGGPAARITGRPEVWHIHDHAQRSSLLEKALLRIPTDFALFTTEKVASGFPRLRRGPSDVVYPVTVEPDVARSLPRNGDVRERYGLPAGRLLLTVGRLQEHKGHRHLVEAAPRVLASCPDASFVVVGKAADRSQETYLGELLTLCGEQGVTERVRFVGDVPDEDLAALYDQASALVHPAESEGFGLAILEAMSRAVPVIAAAAEGPSELIRSGENGLLAARADSESLADAIVQVLESRELTESLVSGGERFVESLSSRRMAEAIAGIYWAVLNRSPPHDPAASLA
jgi:glycosyltransferase involved in cell wall biosynthesis